MLDALITLHSALFYNWNKVKQSAQLSLSRSISNLMDTDIESILPEVIKGFFFFFLKLRI